MLLVLIGELLLYFCSGAMLYLDREVFIYFFY